MTENEQWARKFARKLDKNWKPRWEIYDDFVINLQNPQHICLDLGCGNNDELSPDSEFHFKFGMDLLSPKPDNTGKIPFARSDLYILPLKAKSVDVVLLRYVAEHIGDPRQAFSEIHRVLKPGGKVLILTTNRNSPLILLPGLIPYPLRKKLITYVFKAKDEDIFPTWHRLNSRSDFSKLKDLFEIEKWTYLQDVNWSRKWLFILLFLFHLKTKWLGLRFLQSNILTILKKK